LKKFEIEKSIWTDADFEQMGWHDCTIYGMALKEGNDVLSNELYFDIDYIFKWIHPEQGESSFSFWIAPCTLIFKQVFDLKVDIHAGSSSVFGLEIADIYRVAEIESINGKPQWKWHIELQQGDIMFEAKGYKQIVKKKPIYFKGPQIPSNQRGDVNFGRIPF
jgi:hypothetical protein